MVTGLLTALIIWCLFWGSISPFWLDVISILSGLILGVLGRHSHHGIGSIETIAQHSRLIGVSPLLKTYGCLLLLAFSVCSSVNTALFLIALTLILQLYWAKLHLRTYLSMLTLPLNFLLLSASALLFEWSSTPSGVLNLGILGGWLSISVATQTRTLLVISRALGAISSLYLLTLSTPLHEIIGVMRRARTPVVVIDLMYLIHRYIFILLDLHAIMHNAAKSRLGFQNCSNSIRSTGMIYANLLIRSFRQASAGFDAMESRCFDGDISFLEREKPLTLKHLMLAILLFCLVASVAILGELT